MSREEAVEVLRGVRELVNGMAMLGTAAKAPAVLERLCAEVDAALEIAVDDVRAAGEVARKVRAA